MFSWTIALLLALVLYPDVVLANPAGTEPISAESLSAIVAVLAALSVASERLVEIFKGLVPWLNTQNEDAMQEGWRKAIFQLMAVVSGILTTALCWPAIKDLVPDMSKFIRTEGGINYLGILAVGLLASGGSGFWNSVNTWML